MNAERLMMILKGLHISEKATFLADRRKQFTFKVIKNATKAEIKAAVESLFEVKVKSVAVINTKGKAKRFKNTQGRRSDWKKAYISLYPDQDIDFTVTE